MAKIRIKTPCTSANLGPGFDFLGIALNLYNVFEFDESEEYSEIGFENIDSNLVLTSYKYFFSKTKIEEIPVKIRLLKNDIPESRGLGSSSSAIVAGVLAAEYFSGYPLNENELISIMVELEGHPDNILPCFYGGLVSSFKDNDELITSVYKVSKNLYFNVLIPQYKVKTSVARTVLKDSYPISDYVYNASRVIKLPLAFESGDIDTLKLVLKDKFHEPFRSTLIKEYNELSNKINDIKATLNISGSGPTMLSITDSERSNELLLNVIKELGFKLDIYKLKVSKGVEIKEFI